MPDCSCCRSRPAGRRRVPRRSAGARRTPRASPRDRATARWRRPAPPSPAGWRTDAPRPSCAPTASIRNSGATRRGRRPQATRSDRRVVLTAAGRTAAARPTPPSGKILNRTCVTSPIACTSSSNAWRACGCSGVRASRSAPRWRRVRLARARLEAARARRVALEVARVDLDAPNRARRAEADDRPVVPGPAAPLRFPAVAHVARVARA